MFRAVLFFRCGWRDAITASSLAGAVVTCMFRRGPVKSVGELTGYVTEEPVVVYPVLCNEEFPLVMSIVTQATGWWIVLTWSIAPLLVLIHAFR